MRIGVFTDSYKPYTSGVVRSIETFSQEMRSNGHEVFIFAPRYNEYEKEEGVFRFVSVPAPTQKNFSLAIPLSWNISSTMKKIKLDLIHVHSPFLMGNLGKRVAKKHHLPLVFTYHTLYDKYTHYLPVLQEPSKQLVKKMSIDFANSCDLVVTPTLAIKNHLFASGVKATVVNIPTGLNLAEFRSGDPDWLRERYNIPKENLILLYVGRLGKEKNIEFLFDCFNSVLKNNPRLTLALVGDGPLEEKIKSLISELKIESNVILTGLLDKEDVIHCYTGADIFVFASVTETQGLVLVEAKAAGTPAVAVAAFGAKEMVKHGEDGFLSTMDKEQYTRYLRLLVNNDKLRAKMSLKARENAKLFSAEYTTRMLLVEYDKLLSREKSSIGLK
ncbi:MAG TPA: glycosyltransferase family 4 protein [Firmicutes bacterium]|nr:glycosyltransferase family 4 protein [Bacillota bacterium]